VNIREFDGERGGKYYTIQLNDGRDLVVSRKRGDERVWLGRLEQPGSYRGQRGGIGTIGKLLNEWRASIALDPESAEMYEALTKLAARKGKE
jgi:hypothetical protein